VKYKNIAKLVSNNKRLVAAILAITLGSGILSTGIILAYVVPSETGNKLTQAKNQFSSILFGVKMNFEANFSQILTEMEAEPLGDLLVGKMPTPEEVFFAEWANDWFPHIDISIYGPIIESIGAEKVGDVNIDGVIPNADLNITSHTDPSNINLKQCQTLWDSTFINSLTFGLPTVWFKAIEGSLDDQDLLKMNFNLTGTQLNLICNWINVSLNGWMKNIVGPEGLNPALFFGLFGAGSAFLVLGITSLAVPYIKSRFGKEELTK